MFKSHLIVAWRNITKNKASSALNILGLAAGLTVFILIMLFVRTELSYDRYHAKAGSIYRVIQQQPGNDYLGSNVFAVTPPPLAASLVREFPEVLAAARIDTWNEVLVRVGEKHFVEKRVHWTDPQAFDIFSIPLVRGEGGPALENPYALLLSERAARRLFGGDDPISRTIILQDFGQKAEFKVAGVFRDFPAASHFVMDFVAPFETMAKLDEVDLERWDNQSHYTYALLAQGADPKAVEAKLPALLAKHGAEGPRRLGGKPARFFLQPLTRIHLAPGVNFDISPAGDARAVLLFAAIGFLILIIACVNYINLATARSLKRAKEVGLRKVVGAGRGQLIRQFLGDSLLTTCLALLLALAATALALPAFRSFVERDIVFRPLRDAGLTAGLLGLVVAVGTLAGSYPAFFISSFRPVEALKGKGGSRARKRGLRNALIVAQFAASISLIICTIVVRGQLRFIKGKDMGYQREQILVLTPRGGVRADLEAFKAELRRIPSVLAAASSSSLPNNVTSSTIADWPGRPETDRIPIYIVEADYDFAGLYGLKLAQGRDFSRDRPSDARGAFLINESARKALGWDDPLGRELKRNGGTWKIVGILKDFHMHSVHLPIKPLAVYLDPSRVNRVSVKILGGDIPATLASIRETWRRFAPEYPFEYAFFDEVFDQAYRAERRQAAIFGAFAGLAVFIACLGLVGLASFAAAERTREIGIRKVLGARPAGIMAMLSLEFMKWVVLANLIAWPIGYAAMRSWLGGFAYRIRLTAPMFLGAGLASFFIAAAVIGLQTYRAAAANPAQSIRYE